MVGKRFHCSGVGTTSEFGQPCLWGTALPVATMVQRFEGSERIAALAPSFAC